MVVGRGLQVYLVFCFGPKRKFHLFDLDLDQAEQFEIQYILILLLLRKYI